MVLRGLRVYCMQTLSWRLIAVITVGAMLVPAYYTLIVPSLRARLCFSGFYFAILNWLCAVTVARHGTWRVNGISVAGFSVLGLALFLRGMHMMLHGDPVVDASSLVMSA
jgi:hypothetical protein